MDDGSRLPFFVSILVLLFLAAWFAVCETAIASCSRNRIRNLAERGDSRARKTLEVLDDFDRAITTLLICTNIVHIAAASVVTVFVTRYWGLKAVTLSTVITTIAVFFLGEMLPKSIAKRNSEKLALSVSGLLSGLMKVLSPLSALLAAIGRAAAKITSAEQEVSVTEDEIYDIIEDMTEEGTLDEEQGDLISSALQFGDVTVESIVTPRVDLAAVNIEDSLSDVLAFVKAQNHSRIPVYEGSIDNILGVLQIRKFIKAYLREKDGLVLRNLLDKVLFVHSSTKIDELLPQMSECKVNMAVVTDNYGGTLGIVTIEDILEELVGEIWDEDDVVEEPVIRISDTKLIADAEEHVSDVFEAVGFEDPEENEELVNTLMGEWAYERFSSIPEVDDSFDYYNLHIVVTQMENHRIRKLTVELLPVKEEGGAEK